MSGANAEHIWGIDSGYNVFYHAGIDGIWDFIDDLWAWDIDSNDEYVWALEAESHKLWWRPQGDTEGEWTKLDTGAGFTNLEVAGDGNVWGLNTIDGGSVWYGRLQY